MALIMDRSGPWRINRMRSPVAGCIRETDNFDEYPHYECLECRRSVTVRLVRLPITHPPSATWLHTVQSGPIGAPFDPRNPTLAKKAQIAWTVIWMQLASV